MKKALILIGIVVVVGLSIMGCRKPLNKANYTYFEEVKIELNDTLWSIAKENVKDGDDIRSYIDEIKKLNNLKSDKIVSGHYIVILK